MNEVCFFSLFTHDFTRMARDMQNSVKRFYPDVPINLVEINAYDQNAFCEFANVGLWMSQRYKRVIFIGVDQIMCDVCPHLFYLYDIAAPRNNTNYLSQYSSTVNGGLLVSTSKDFWQDWKELLDSSYSKGNTNVIESQNLLNDIFWTTKYNTEILSYDDVSYGIDVFDQYKDMKVIDGKLYCGDKKICIFHAAGDEYKKGNQILFDKLPIEGSEFLKELIHD
jgi:hypothetical protein